MIACSTYDRLGIMIKEERCIAAFSDQNQSTQRPKDYNIWAYRGHPCSYQNEMALLVLLVTFCIKSPSSRAQSPSFGGGARVRLGFK